MAIVNVYIDGLNLYYGAVRDSPYRWLDLSALCARMLPNDAIQTIHYYTAIVSGRPHDPQQPLRQQIYLRALRTIPNLSINFGKFTTHSRRMVLTGTDPPQKVWVDRTDEKGSDVNLAAHLLADAFQKRFEVAVLITNDSDLLEPVRIVSRELGYPVGILNPHQYHSCSLKPHATFMKRIRQSDLAACQFPSSMADNKGQFHKPSGW
jgi:NYN domain